MKKFVFSIFLVAILALSLPPTALAAPAKDQICLPGPIVSTGYDCQQTGPWIEVHRLAEYGLINPDEVVPATAPDTSLTYLPYYYGQVTADSAPVFATIEDAMAGKPVLRNLESGFNYISYIDLQVIDGKKFYMITFGEWMRGGDVSGGVAVSQFMGLEFYATPVRKFGWMLQNVEARVAPSVNAEFAELSFVRWDLIQVYDIQEAEGLTWYMVAPDQWIDSRDAALVYPVTEAPAGVDNGRWIEVNLFEQTFAVYENGHMIYASLLSSGVPGFWTRPGLFRISEKLETTPMRGAFEADRSDYYYLEDVPWTMYFDEARALHGAYWHTRFGYEQSHGCVNLSAGDSKWLYDWAVVGDWVYVWDPSGKTPEDPSLYGAGGA